VAKLTNGGFLVYIYRLYAVVEYSSRERRQSNSAGESAMMMFYLEMERHFWKGDIEQSYVIFQRARPRQ
jgi:hypothetical protein